ncbi:RecQ family ATP-dependent DNA helicase [Sphingomonas sp. MMS24-JH45]
MFAIDEAHCVSEWGTIPPTIACCARCWTSSRTSPRLALTATADAHTRDDEQLGIPREGMIVAGFDRPNIRYSISPRDNTTRQLVDLIRAHPGPGIVYAQTRAATEKLAAALAVTGRPTRAYHAGLDPAVRARNQADFVGSEDMVIAATVAFGMGIDKPDVRFVAHAGLPKSIEADHQETGRAGRDGDPAVAHLFLGADDFARARQRIGEVEAHRQPGQARAAAVARRAGRDGGCRRAILLRHFGEDPPERRGNCDNCLSPPKALDATQVARKYLSAVFRTGQMFGATYVEEVLTGKSSERSLMNGHEALSVWNIVGEGELALLKPVGRALLLRDALRTNPHGGLEFGPAAKAILKGEAEVALLEPPARAKPSRGRGGSAEANPVRRSFVRGAARVSARPRQGGGGAALCRLPRFGAARDRRAAAGEPVGPGYVAGVGQRKLDAYGAAFLKAVRENRRLLRHGEGTSRRLAGGGPPPALSFVAIPLHHAAPRRGPPPLCRGG